MATTDTNLADRSGNLVEAHKNYDPRIVFFYFVLATLMAILVVGLGYRQLTQSDEHARSERQQNQRRVIFPGPRGNIYDRNGRLLVGNNHQFAVLLHLDDLKAELARELTTIRNNYRKVDDKDIPTYRELQQISRVSLVQRYLDQVNRILGRIDKVDSKGLQRHFDQQLLLPYTLIDKLEPAEYARLVENLPVNSPLEVYASNVRAYPYGSAAAHTLGYVRFDTEVDAKDFPGKELTTFKMKGTRGRDGLEKTFDAQLQGEAGGRIYLVDPSGYRIAQPLAERKPKQGKHLTTSLNIDLQMAAEQAIADQTGAAVALDVATGEVLVMASMPNYDLNAFSPRASTEVVAKMNETGAWNNLATTGLYEPGSTFKIVVSVAGLRSGRLDPDDTTINCDGVIYLGKTKKTCDNGLGHHGHSDLAHAISVSCDVYYYLHGIGIGPKIIADEARRFRLDRPTGIEVGEQKGMIIPDPAWKREKRGEPWTDGDTANTSIGQGDVLVTPIDMACFIASFARDELTTQPTLLHDPNRLPQHSEPIGLTAAQRATIIKGMEGVLTVPGGTAYPTLGPRGPYRIPGLRIAGKTGTAQHHKVNVAWFVCFAPVEHPEIAIAVALEGDTPGENFGGGQHAAPVASAILKKYFESKANPQPVISRVKAE